ncbi:MAG: rhodanese-like domain-containing protein [Burkholderiales bacterium]
MRTVNPRQLKAMLQDGRELALLDVREAGQFGKSHLLFAIPLPYSRLELDIGRLVPRHASRVVLCDDGEPGIAALAARRLERIGYADIAVLDGGTRSWAGAGYPVYSGVNVPSKVFGEIVEHAYHTPHVTAGELRRMKEAGEDLVILDGRPVNEHHRMTIPGSICCPNAELPYRVAAMVKNPRTKIVVNCAGRTRSIVGAQTLINYGIPNPVFALENGTQGWYLADFKLEHGSTRRYPDQPDPASLSGLQAAAEKLMKRFAVRLVAAGEVSSWLKESGRTTYLCDVRTPEEFAAGSIPGALHAPGGQLIQATDQWIGVRNARIVLIDDGETIRAPMVASWLKQLGCDACVLEGGVRAELRGTPVAKPDLPALATISAPELKSALGMGGCTVLDLRPSLDFRKAHIPGSRWSIRPRLVREVRDKRKMIVLVAHDTDPARLGAIDLLEAGATNVRLLDAGFAAWMDAGYPADSTPGDPSDANCIDYLFFVHDRHGGNREAMKQYLAWETGLVAQLDEQERAAFKIGPVMGEGQ